MAQADSCVRPESPRKQSDSEFALTETCGPDSAIPFLVSENDLILAKWSVN